MSVNELVGEKIKLLRETFNLSQSKLGAKIGVSKGTVLRWEHGRCRPSEIYLNQIAQTFGFHVDWLLNNNEVELSNPVIKGNFSFPFEGDTSNTEDIVASKDFDVSLTTTTVGERIKILRERKRLTQEDFAKDLGVRCRTIRSWERGKTRVRMISLKKISELFDVSIDWLKNGIESEIDTPEWLRGDFDSYEIESLPNSEVNALTYWIKHGNDIKEDTFTRAHSKFDEAVIASSSSNDITQNINDKAMAEYNSDKEHLVALFSRLSVYRQGKLLGYLDALCREELLSDKS